MNTSLVQKPEQREQDESMLPGISQLIAAISVIVDFISLVMASFGARLGTKKSTSATSSTMTVSF
jgi:hypothetical protein